MTHWREFLRGLGSAVGVWRAAMGHGLPPGVRIGWYGRTMVDAREMLTGEKGKRAVDSVAAVARIISRHSKGGGDGRKNL